MKGPTAILSTPRTDFDRPRRGLCLVLGLLLVSTLGLDPLQAAEDAKNNDVVEKVAEKAEATALVLEKEAQKLEAEAGEMSQEALQAGEKLGREALELGKEGLGETEKKLKNEIPAIEQEASALEKEAEALDRKWMPKLEQELQLGAEKLKSGFTAVEMELSRDAEWLKARWHTLSEQEKKLISHDILQLDVLSPGLGSYVFDEMRHLRRATQMEIRKGRTAVERTTARFLKAGRRDLAAAGHWVHAEVAQAEDKLTAASVRVRKDVLDWEKKADFWLEGRPLSDAQAEAAIAHHNLLVSNEYPSAALCAECHPGQYRQWSVSQHAYAQLSPVFNSMSERINRITNGTNADFCIRCHNEVGMSIGEPIFIPNADRLPVTREGISCIVCHRVENAYGRVSGRFGISKGNLTQPMYGPTGPDVLNEVLDKFKVTTTAADGSVNWEKDGAQVIHRGAVEVKTFKTAQLCSNCHDVNSQNVFRLEEAYSQFRNAPAAAEGTVCQDCHMGKVLGKVSGYDEGPIAYIGGVPTPTGKRTNHMFAGPDYSIVHPGIFPHNPEAESIASFREWLQFDVGAGWGTKEFEKEEHPESDFPPAWKKRRHRLRAGEFIKNQLQLLGEIRAQSFRTLRLGYQLGNFRVTRNDPKGLAFRIEVRNATNGHAAPTGFDGEREVFLHVVVRDRDGQVVFQSGDRDPNGDVRNLHSSYVRDGKVPLDGQLFSLQSKFLELSARGGERERILPIPVSQGALPFLRPNTSSSLFTAHPTNTRKQAAGIPPLGHFEAKYKVPAKVLTGKPPYTVELSFIAQMVPVNLIEEISSVGFDYDLSARNVANRVVMGGFPLWSHRFELGPKGSSRDLTPTEEEVLGPEAVTPALPWLKHPQSWTRTLPDGTTTTEGGSGE